eukprot:10151800-Alexandrium_andersonii.AAC.1
MAGYSPTGPLKPPHRTMGKFLQVAISATTSARRAALRSLAWSLSAAPAQQQTTTTLTGTLSSA